MAAYRAGEFALAQRLCNAQIEARRDGPVAREAQALQALMMLRASGRDERLAGRNMLSRLAQDDPALLERPECQFALGIAALELLETSRALEQLDEAARGFEALNLPEREIAALSALADAWLRHTEWETTPPRFQVKRGLSAEQVRAVQLGKAAAIRDRVAAFEPAPVAALARMDFLLARDLLTRGERRADALRTLGALAAAEPLTPAGADAALLLARELSLMSPAPWADVLALYRRVVDRSIGEAAAGARQLLEALTSPSLALALPQQVAAGRPVALHVTARNISGFQVEVRQVDLAGWLAARRGRYAAAVLPTAGSVRFAREVELPELPPYEEWRSAQLAAPLSFEAPAGAYVVTVTPAAKAGGLAPLKQLLLVSDLAAVVCTTGQDVVIWATRQTGGSGYQGVDGAGAAGVQAQFWIEGAFQPERPAFANGVAQFEVPAAANILRSKRWLCLLQDGEHLALCFGDLSEALRSHRALPVALIVGAGAPRANEPLQVCGLRLGGRSDAAQTDADWRLELRDPLDRLVAQAPVEMLPGGLFSARVPLAGALAGEHVRLTVQRGAQAAALARGRVALQIAGERAGLPAVECQAVTPAAEGLLGAHVEAWLPWGWRLEEPDIGVVVRMTQLPAAENDYTAFSREPFSLHAHAHDHGGAEAAEQRTSHAHGAHSGPGGILTIPEQAFGWSKGPLAVGLWARATGPGGGAGYGEDYVLHGAAPLHAWVTYSPETPVQGQPVEFLIAWYDPKQQAGPERPSLQIAQDDQLVTELELRAGLEGMLSEAWRPPAAGEYEVVALLPRLNHAPFEIRRTIDVAPATETPAPGLSAEWVKTGAGMGIRCALTHMPATELLLLAEADGSLSAQVVQPDQQEVVMPIDGLAGLQAQVALVAMSGGAPAILSTARLAPAAGPPLALAIDPAGELLAGSRARLRVVCDAAPPGGSVLIRIIPAGDTGQVGWLPGQAREATLPPAPLQLTSGTGRVSPDQPAVPPQALSPRLNEALYEGATLWTDAVAWRAGGIEVELPIPADPQMYRVHVLARFADGRTSTASALMDARAGLAMRVDMPPHLSVGDRTMAAVALHNVGDAPQAARFDVDPGVGLHIERMLISDGRHSEPLVSRGETPTVTVPPGERRWVQLWIEAAAAGAGRLEARLITAGGLQRAGAAYRVGVPPAQAASSPLRIARTVFRLPGTPSGYLGKPTSETERLAHAEVLPEGASLALGQMLLVREEFMLPEEYPRLEWVQAAPPNCHLLLGGSPVEELVGTLEYRGLHELRMQLRRPEPGFRVNEYIIVAARPGVCLLPPPAVVVGDEVLPVALEPASTWLQVPAPETIIPR